MSSVFGSFLIFALNNLSKEALGDGNTVTLSNFLSQFVAAFTFDDALSIYGDQVQKNIPNIKAVHLYSLNGRRIPLSYLLQGIYNNITGDFANLTSGNQGLEGYVKTTITPPSGFKTKLDWLSAGRVYGPPRWQAISSWSMEKTKIKMNFLKNFNDMIKSTKI